jgi:MerR family redox-sensitive transcriptional activator SoxR
MYLSIGQVAERLGVSASALRYYEAEGLVPLAFRRSGKRVYSENDINLFRLLLLGREVGLGISELKAMKIHFQNKEGDVQNRDNILQTLLGQVDQQMVLLESKRALLVSAINCSCKSPMTCKKLNL